MNNKKCFDKWSLGINELTIRVLHKSHNTWWPLWESAIVYIKPCQMAPRSQLTLCQLWQNKWFLVFTVSTPQGPCDSFQNQNLSWWSAVKTFTYWHLKVVSSFKRKFVVYVKIYTNWLRQWLGISLVPSHYLHQCWLIVNWTPRNKLWCNFNQNKGVSIQENALKMFSANGLLLCSGIYMLKYGILSAKSSQ